MLFFTNGTSISDITYLHIYSWMRFQSVEASSVVPFLPEIGTQKVLAINFRNKSIFKLCM